MRRPPAVLAVLVAAALGLAGCATLLPRTAPRAERLRVPGGFAVELFASGLEEARGLAFGEGGTLFAGSYHPGKVYAVTAGKGGAAPVVRTIAEGLRQPHGVAFRDGDLYVAETERILRFRGIESRLDDPPAPEVVVGGLPRYAHHALRPIRFGPDGLLWVAIGSPCNVCDAERDRYGVIARVRPGGRLEVFARGVRNSVGFDWRPGTRELWFTDNGRDFLGNDAPPDELNRAPRRGLDFGFPRCHAGELEDPVFGQSVPCSAFAAPAAKLGAHVAALGMVFYDAEAFPAEYRGRIFVAEHGSWNRTPKSGYRVTMVTLDRDRVVAYEPFVEGWLDGGSAWGRPVDVAVGPDGALYVSDDEAGAVWRVRWRGAG